jgi:hypothetical protein
MKHVLKDGDYLNILKIPKKDGTFVNEIPMTFAYLEKSKKLLYDDSNLINKIYWKLRKNNLKSSSIGKRMFYFVLHDGVIKYIEVGNSIHKLLNKDCSFSYNIKDNLHIVKEMINSSIGLLPSYDKSYITKSSGLFSSEQEYHDFILNNQPFYLEDYLYKNSALNNIHLIKEEYGDVYFELLEEERDNKINLILEKEVNE